MEITQAIGGSATHGVTKPKIAPVQLHKRLAAVPFTGKKVIAQVKKRASIDAKVEALLDDRWEEDFARGTTRSAYHGIEDRERVGIHARRKPGMTYREPKPRPGKPIIELSPQMIGVLEGTARKPVPAGTQQALFEKLRQTDEPAWRAIQLMCVNNLSTRDAATALACDQSTASRRVHRGLDQMIAWRERIADGLPLVDNPVAHT